MSLPLKLKKNVNSLFLLNGENLVFLFKPFHKPVGKLVMTRDYNLQSCGRFTIVSVFDKRVSLCLRAVRPGPPLFAGGLNLCFQSFDFLFGEPFYRQLLAAK